MAGIDLDDLSGAYSHRPITEAGRRRATLSATDLNGIVVDAGGGTGAHSEVFTGLGLRPVVLDVNSRMCAEAVARGVRAVTARSELMPVSDGSAALVYFHLSIHYGDWAAALDEAVRITAPGGRVEIWTFGRSGIERSSLATWFPTVGRIDVERFPDPSGLAAHLDRRCSGVRVESHDDLVERTAGDWVEAVRARFVSTLQLVPDAEIEAGIKAFEEAHPDPDGSYAHVLEYRRISAAV